MFLVTIEVIAYDRTGLMADILAVLMELKLSVSTANVKVENTGIAGMNLGIQIKDLQQLEIYYDKNTSYKRCSFSSSYAFFSWRII